MTADEKRRTIVRALLSTGWRSIRNDGNHEIYGCPCGKHIAPVPRHNAISAGVARKIRKTIIDCQEGR